MPDDQFQFFKDHFPSKNNFKASEIKKIWNSFHFSSNSMQCQSELHKNFWLLFQSLMRVAEDTVFENCKKISRACIIWDFSDMIFNPLWEVWLSLPKNLQSYARIAKSRSTFLDREKRASRKWLAQSFWIWWMTSLLQKCQAMIMQSKVNNIKRKMVNCRNYSIVVSREMHWLLFW